MSQKTDARRFARNLLFFLFIFVVLMEVGLRIHDPFHLRLKGNKIVLPVDQQVIITNQINPKLDAVIVNTRNHLGFRGANLPADTGSLLKIVTVGGSATECHFLNDDKTWPYLLGKALADSLGRCWLNNAGFDGHSTYGHIILLNDHVKQLRPSAVVFLAGINDVEANSPTFHDNLNTRGGKVGWRHYLFENSEVLNVALTFFRGWRSQRFNNTTDELLVLDSVRRQPLSEGVMRARLAAQEPFLAGYRSRLEQLADTCLAWHILPVFLTQPDQFGAGRDPVTGADLELFPVDGPDAAMNGELLWEMLERYNDVVRSVCAERGLPMVDLARLMPKNSLYFYDMTHFTNQGAAEVSRLLSGPLSALFRQRFPYLVE